jgi:hypothetical protein
VIDVDGGGSERSTAVLVSCAADEIRTRLRRRSLSEVETP